MFGNVSHRLNGIEKPTHQPISMARISSKRRTGRIHDASGFFGVRLVASSSRRFPHRRNFLPSKEPAIIAQLVSRRTPELASDDNKEEILVIKKSTYMDDIIDSVKNLDIAGTRTSILEKLLATGTFKNF